VAYTVLARRYRSQSFGDVVGQEAIARTLTNAIAQNRVAHAYLFTGTRGVGKTSMARIFARALNAPDTVDDAPRLGSEAGDDEAFEYPEPDVQQRMADAIMKGDDLNVIELDGASNRGIDDARDIIARASLSPTGNARFKVYIIDEVHQLTKDAFNALLKLMEEPPPHVKFILATTEPQKVLPTIQSRCQRFDFRNIPTRLIEQHLTAVCAKEGIGHDGHALHQVARLGNGSMRDALSLLDRVIAAGGDRVTTQLLDELLGLPDQQVVAGLIDAAADGDPAGALAKADELLNRGISQDQLVEALIERLRQLMLIAACGPDSQMVELSEEARSAAVEQAGRFDAAALVHMIALLEALQRNARSAANPRALLDATVVRLALSEKMLDLGAWLAGGGAPPGKAGSSARPSGRSAPPAQTQPASSRPVRRAGDRPAPPPAEAAGPKTPRVDASDPSAVWKALLDRSAEVPALGWLDHVRLAALTEDTATLAPAPGKRKALELATESRCGRLAAELAGLLGRRVKIELRRPTAPQDGSPDRASGGGSTASADARRDAMSLPLVREAMQAFPEATLIDVRAEDDDADG